jgi:hypothetical protein
VDGYLRTLLRETLAGAQVKRHVLPSPIVHEQFQRSEGRRTRLLCYIGLLAIGTHPLAFNPAIAVLSANRKLMHRLVRDRTNCVQHIHLRLDLLLECRVGLSVFEISRQMAEMTGKRIPLAGISRFPPRELDDAVMQSLSQFFIA